MKKATQWRQEKQSLEAKIAALAEGRLAFAGTFRKPDDIHLLSRGDPEQPKDRVAPAVLSVLSSKRLPADSADQERRRVLADWIADSGNPLTARVIVNRIWQGHFGVGLVETASDFGNSGLNILEGPGRNLHHMSLAKTFRFTERFSFDLMGAATNLFNHPHFAFPNTNVSVPSGGVITTAYSYFGADKAAARRAEVRGRIRW